MTTSARSLLAVILLGAVGAGGCTGAGEFSPDAAASAIAATVAAMAPTGTAAELPTAEEHTLPGETPSPAPAGLVVVYTDDGNAFLLAGAGPAVPLTTWGDVEDVRLSDDGRRIAYTRRASFDQPVELRAVNRDGTGDASLMAPADFDSLYPLGGALHHDLYAFEFIPGGHQLLINTRSTFEGPGLAKHDDLLRIDTDTLARTMLLAPGTGGDFTISPDGRYLAVTRPDTIEIRTIDGSSTASGVISYTPVITYSEYAYYAHPVWNMDSTAIGVAVPSPDPLAPSTSGSIWQLPVGSAASLSGTISGKFFLFSADGPLVSPDLAHVAYARTTSTVNVLNLYRSALDGSGEVLVGTFEAWIGWAPDGQHFVYADGDAMTLLLGDLAGGSAPLVTGTDLRWFSPNGFVFQSGMMGAWDLLRGGIGEASTPLASPGGDFVSYDFTYR